MCVCVAVHMQEEILNSLPVAHAHRHRARFDRHDAVERVRAHAAYDKRKFCEKKTPKN